MIKKTEGSPFTNLSPDLKLEIARWLHPIDIACMSLTCQSLYHNEALRQVWKAPFSLKRPRFRGRARATLISRDFLRVLAKDLPSMTLCFYCRKFHPHRDTPKICHDFRQWASCPRSTLGMWLHLEGWRFHLQFEDLYKVMTRHKWGAPHGDPLEAIAVQTDWEPSRWDRDMDVMESKKEFTLKRTGWMKKLDVVPEIIKDHLILRTDQRMLFNPNSRESLKSRGIGRHLFRPCQHWSWILPGERTRQTGEDVESLIYSALNRVHPRLVIPSFTQTRGLVHKCSLCLTEYRVSVWDHGYRGIEVLLTTWTNLGIGLIDLTMEWVTAAHQLGDVYSYADVQNLRNDNDQLAQYVSKRFPRAIKPPLTGIRHPSFRKAFEDPSFWEDKEDLGVWCPIRVLPAAKLGGWEPEADDEQKKGRRFITRVAEKLDTCGRKRGLQVVRWLVKNSSKD